MAGSGADGDRSGVVDAADLAIWEANHGAGIAPPVKAVDSTNASQVLSSIECRRKNAAASIRCQWNGILRRP